MLCAICFNLDQSKILSSGDWLSKLLIDKTLQSSQPEGVLLSNLQKLGKRKKNVLKKWFVNTDPGFSSFSHIVFFPVTGRIHRNS